MKTFLILASFFFLAAVPSRAAQYADSAEGAEAASAPVVDSFEDGALRLRLVGLPSPDGASLEVTLVYEDDEQQTLRSVTVDPALVATTHATTYNEFLGEIDPDFVSFVRASLADRLMHLRAAPSRFERAESALFFPHGGRGSALARGRTEEAGRAE